MSSIPEIHLPFVRPEDTQYLQVLGHISSHIKAKEGGTVLHLHAPID